MLNTKNFTLKTTINQFSNEAFGQCSTKPLFQENKRDDEEDKETHIFNSDV